MQPTCYVISFIHNKEKMFFIKRTANESFYCHALLVMTVLLIMQQALISYT